MRRILLVGTHVPLLRQTADQLAQKSTQVEVFDPSSHKEYPHSQWDYGVYVAWDRCRLYPNKIDHGSVLSRMVASVTGGLVLLSSTLIYPSRHGHGGMVSESRPSAKRCDPVSAGWLALEKNFVERMGSNPTLQSLILRCVPLQSTQSNDLLNRYLQRRVAFSFLGHDPMMQFLSVEQLASALHQVCENATSGVVHLAPQGAVSSKQAKTHGLRVPLPWSVQYLARKMGFRLGLAADIHEAERLRYGFTVSNHAFKQAMGIGDQQADGEPIETRDGEDEFGGDRRYIDGKNRGLLGFLHDRYWRVEYRGISQVPNHGRGIMLGVHRGFMPFDGTMVLCGLARNCNRYPRFLIHPCLNKPPLLSTFMRKLGGVIANRENADTLLQRGALVGIFPEGIRGAFTYYKDAYTLGSFGKNDFVKLALRNRAPIYPFVTLGSAEIFPIFGSINWAWLRRYTEWPFLPVTPTFPLVPLPLPSKWHTEFLKPIVLHEKYPPRAAEDRALVSRIGAEIRETMQAALTSLRAQRRHLFYGSLFSQSHGAEKGLKVAK